MVEHLFWVMIINVVRSRATRGKTSSKKCLLPWIKKIPSFSISYEFYIGKRWKEWEWEQCFGLELLTCWFIKVYLVLHQHIPHIGLVYRSEWLIHIKISSNREFNIVNTNICKKPLVLCITNDNRSSLQCCQYLFIHYGKLIRSLHHWMPYRLNRNKIKLFLLQLRRKEIFLRGCSVVG